MMVSSAGVIVVVVAASVGRRTRRERGGELGRGRGRAFWTGGGFVDGKRLVAVLASRRAVVKRFGLVKRGLGRAGGGRLYN